MVTGVAYRGLRGLTKDVAMLVHAARDEYRQSRRVQEYFASLASGCALLAECPRDLLETETRRLGMPIEGRSKLEIARAIFEVRQRS